MNTGRVRHIDSVYGRQQVSHTTVATVTYSFRSCYYEFAELLGLITDDLR